MVWSFWHHIVGKVLKVSMAITPQHLLLIHYESVRVCVKSAMQLLTLIVATQNGDIHAFDVVA